MKFATPEYRQQFALPLVRRGHQVHYRSTDLTEAENAYLNAVTDVHWVPFPADGVELNPRFKRARLLKGWRWSDPRDHFVHAVEGDHTGRDSSGQQTAVKIN